MTRVLIVTGDPIAARMAGPAIRAWNMARELQARGHEVRIVTTAPPADDPPAAPPVVVSVAAGDGRRLREHERWAEMVIVQGYALGQFPALRRTDRILVCDLYDPLHIELLEQGRDLPRATWELRVATARDAVADQLARADLVLCASERQRMLYLGHLAGLGRVAPALYADDPQLERLLAVVPFGLPAEPPVAEPVLRGRVAGIDADSRVLVWGGGVYDWFDPLSLIRAVAALRDRIPALRLFFLGTRHPKVGDMGVLGDSVRLAEELGVAGREVVFNDDWVPYESRGAYLLEADAGVSTHHLHVETTFSFRTRILDYLWAGLPMVVTEGDSFAELVAAEELGAVVAADDPASIAAGIEDVLGPRGEHYRANVARVRERFTWAAVLEPVLRLADDPRHATDYRPGRRMAAVRRPRRTAGLGHDIRMAAHHLRHGGLGALRGRLAARRGDGR